ncbi:MAG: hypothetical protein ABI811_01880 [Acidobacteriota bacterium]
MRLLVACCLFAFSIAQHWAWPSHDDFLFLDEAVAAGTALGQTGTLANPFHAMPTGPTAHVAPGFPLLVAGIVKIWGNGLEAYRALILMGVLTQALFLALLPWVAEALGFTFYTGLTAACLALFAQVPTFANWESSYVALLAAMLTGLIARGGRETLVSVLWGVLILFSPVMLGVFAVYYLRADRKRMIWALVIVAPWIVRNYGQFGRLVMVRDNLGLELHLANNPCASFSLRGNIETQCHQQYHPNVNAQEAMLVRSLGEVAYNDRQLNSAAQWIMENQARFAELSWQRVAHFWFPAEGGDYRQYEVVVWVTTVLSIPGLVLVWRERPGTARMLGTWLIFFPLVYYVIQFDLRYRVPIIWITFLLAANALNAAGRYFVNRARSTASAMAL